MIVIWSGIHVTRVCSLSDSSLQRIINVYTRWLLGRRKEVVPPIKLQWPGRPTTHRAMDFNKIFYQGRFHHSRQKIRRVSSQINYSTVSHVYIYICLYIVNPLNRCGDVIGVALFCVCLCAFIQFCLFTSVRMQQCIK